MSDLTEKQINFCIEYIQSRDIKTASINAGYSETFSKSKAYELLSDERIKAKIEELEKEYFQQHFKKLSLVANSELENILINSKNDSTKLKAIELIYKLSGIMQDEKMLTIKQEVTTPIPDISEFYNS